VGGGDGFIRTVGSSGGEDRALLPGEILATGELNFPTDGFAFDSNTMEIVFSPTGGDVAGTFAYSINAWVEPGDAGVYGADPPTALPGFPSRDDLIARYADATGADLSNLAYYRTFNSFKTACILHGVYARYRAGQKSTEGIDVDMLFARIGLSLDAAEARSTEID